MKIAYVDTSCLAAIAFKEPQQELIARRLDRFDQLASSNLLEAELRAVYAREDIEWRDELVAGIFWVNPDRPLRAEIQRVLSLGYVRGADCWHLANALYFAGDAKKISFITLDNRQKKIADELGFETR